MVYNLRAKCATILLALFYSFGIRLKLEEKQLLHVDNSCAELGEQKHDGATTPSKVVTTEIHSI